MCLRHPANVPALITELQAKLEEDKYLIAEIKARLWEQNFEKQTHMLSFRQMKNLVKEAVLMQDKLLEFRFNARKQLVAQAAEDEKALASGLDKLTTSPKSRAMRAIKKNAEKIYSITSSNEKTSSWEETWSLISSRTGIIEPESFFERINNR
jgi:MinD-like ATPase involved in chromosome partitioning or flagellar assembly